MKLPISPRLLACASFVRPGERVADVGCDHGYLSIYLLKNGIASRVYASDVSPQPLQKAKLNAQKHEVSQNLSLHLCDGVRGLPREFDVLILAGMGAETMEAIIGGGPWLRDPGYRLVLQCQSSQNELRRFLWQNGWRIAREEPIRDGRLYTVLEAVRGTESLTPGQEFVSPALLHSGSPLVPEYIAFCRRIVDSAVKGLASVGGDRYDYYSRVQGELAEMEAQL